MTVSLELFLLLTLLIGPALLLLLLRACWCRRTGSRSPVIPRSSKVQDLRVEVSPCEPSFIISWDPPLGSEREETKYDITFKNVSYVHPSISMTETSVVLKRGSGLKPLVYYDFEVRPRYTDGVIGKWSTVRKFIDWYCRLPSCRRNRLAFGTHVYDFCCKGHYKVFAARYCLYPECTNQKLGFLYRDFCSQFHLRLAIEKNFTALVEMHPESQEYDALSQKFKNAWATEKGTRPQIRTILRIVSPANHKRLEDYKESLPLDCQEIEQYFHGTKMACNVTTYLEYCKYSSCGVCGIAQGGFDRTRIRRNKFQRFGPGFYLAPQSSKCYDYPLNQQRCQAMLLCDVVPGRKCSYYYNATELNGPPDGYHSVYGKARWLWIFGNL